MDNLKIIFYIVMVALDVFATDISVSQTTELWSQVVQAKYSYPIKKIIEEWKKPNQHLSFLKPEIKMHLQAIPTEGDDTYVGILAQVKIEAKLKDVLQVLNDTKNYINVYQDLEKVELKTSNADEQVLSWIFSGPLGIKTKYTTVQQVAKSGEAHGYLIYQLKESKDVTASDGMILLEEKDGAVYFTSIDFFNADWGAFAKLFKGKIWSETCESTAKATFSIQKLAESIYKEKPIQKVEFKKEYGYDAQMVLQSCGQMKNRSQQIAFEKVVNEILYTDKGSQSHSR